MGDSFKPDSFKPDSFSPDAPAPTPQEMANRELAKHGLSVGPVPSPPPVEMKRSTAPDWVRGLTGTLPVIGGVGGALAGAPAAGWGALAGGGLGAAAGEQGRLLTNRAILGPEETSPISKEGLTSTAIAGGTAAAAEVPAAIMGTLGKNLLGRIAAAQSEKQVGNAVEGIMRANPSGISKAMLLRDVEKAAQQDAVALRTTLSRSSQPVSIDAVVANARQQAADTVTQAPILKAVPKRLDMVIAAAKRNAGITGSQATPQQVFDFMQQLQKPAYVGNPGPVAQILKDLNKQVYRDAGVALRRAAPESDQILARLTNYHAATDAISNYNPGRVASLAVSAATHPKTAAAVSPLVVGAAAASPQILGMVKKAPSEVLK